MAGFRAANEFRHDSERRVAEALAKSLPRQVQLVGNYVLPGRYAGGEIDLVAILPEGIVAIEVKCWHGRVYRVGALVEFDDGYTTPNPFPGLQYKAKVLRRHLVNRGLIDTRLPVGGCLVYVGDFEIPDEVAMEEHIFSLVAAKKRSALLQSLAVHGRNATLGDPSIAAIADALADDTDGTDTWRVGHFLLDEELEPTDFTRQFVGRCAHIYERDVLLRCWKVDPLAPKRTRALVLKKLEAEASALARLESYRCRSIPVIYDAFRDPADFDVFWLAQEHIGSRTLADRAHRFVKEPSFRDHVLEQLDEAISTLRKAGIVHRNLGAEVISIGDDDRILVGGLELSSAADGHTCRRTVLRRTRRPPEVAQGERDSHASDMFAVGVMVLDLLVPGEDAPRKRIRRIRQKHIAAALAACIDSEPRDRPTSLDDLRSVLEGWES